MIKIFDSVMPWPNKVNFIQDDPMVFVGYDTDQNCCENFSWQLLSEDGHEIEPDEHGCIPYEFDLSHPLVPDQDWEDNDEISSTLRIPLLGDRQYNHELHEWFRPPGATLVLSNCHNGYYSHGWGVATVTQKGAL